MITVNYAYRQYIYGDSRLYRELFEIFYEIRLHNSGKQFIGTVDCQSGFRQSWTQSHHGDTGLLVVIRILFENKHN